MGWKENKNRHIERSFKHSCGFKRCCFELIGQIQGVTGKTK